MATAPSFFRHSVLFQTSIAQASLPLSAPPTAWMSVLDIDWRRLVPCCPRKLLLRGALLDSGAFCRGLELLLLDMSLSQVPAMLPLPSAHPARAPCYMTLLFDTSSSRHPPQQFRRLLFYLRRSFPHLLRSAYYFQPLQTCAIPFEPQLGYIDHSIPHC